MKLRKWKLLSAAAACIAVAVGGAVCAGAETGESDVLNDDFFVEVGDEIDEALMEKTADGFSGDFYCHVDDFYCYINDDGVVEIDEYNGSATELVIPDTLDGRKVAAIGDFAFYDCKKLTSVTIPGSVISIGGSPFKGCTNLTSINVDDDNAYYMSKDGVLFSKDMSKIIEFPYGKGGSYIIPNSVTSIGDGAFSDCINLTGVAIPDGVTFIERNAFYGCVSLTSLAIPDSVTAIGSSAFSGCANLTSIKIPDSVISIGWGAFYECTSLVSVTIPNSVTYVEDKLFYGCTSLKSVTIPDSVTSIGDYAFSDCTKLISVSLPDSIVTIEYKAFYSCTSLKNVTIPKNVMSIRSQAFTNCTSLDSVNVDNNNAYYKSENGVLFNKNMSELITFPGSRAGSYVIPDSVKSIEDFAFYNCDKLTGITFPNNIDTIRGGAFKDCKSLTSVSIPNSVTYIGSFAFNGCTSLKNAIVSDNVKDIFYSLFSGCTNLTSVTIPDSVTSIGNYAFEDCNKLTIYGYYASYAETYAKENNIPFVSLDAPKFTSKVTATSGNRSIKLSWNAVDDATNYIVKSADGSTQYTKNAITATTYTVTGLKNGTQYKFKVYAKIGGKWYDSSVVTKTPVAKPENVKAVANNKKVALSWDKVPNATNYIVKSADGSVQYTKKAITTTSYTVTGLTNSTQYKFKVYAKSDGKWFASSTISKTPTAKPQNLKAVAGSKKITLSWDKVDGATGYIVKSSDGKTQYTKNAIKTNSYTVTGLTGSKQYKFKVYAKVDGKWYASSTITRTTKK